MFGNSIRRAIIDFPNLLFRSSNRSTAADLSRSNNKVNNGKQINSLTPPPPASNGLKREAACQTLSTGDIVMMKVFFDEDKNNADSVLMSSPKREK